MGLSAGLDRRGLAVLAAGHACADTAQGAVPALLPFLIDQRGISYSAAGVLILVTSVGSRAESASASGIRLMSSSAVMSPM